MSSSSLLHAAMLRWLNELSSQGIFTTDCDLIVRSWNVWLARATGLDESQVLNRPLFDVLPELRQRQLDHYYVAALTGQANVLSHRFHKHLVRVASPTGQTLQSARIAPLLHEDEIVGTITVIDDVSERVDSEAELRRQIAAAEQARHTAEDALRVKDEFLATLSHELRTPLNAVLGWTRILLGQTVDPAMATHALQVIDRNATAQARLIDDMLDMARIVTGKLRLEMGPVDVVTATLAAIDVVAPSAQAKGIAIDAAFEKHPRLITADADRVQQMVWNVLANAVKFTPNGGKIEVRITGTPDVVNLVISDSGKGISAESLPFVFERFRQANASVNRHEGGLGLGLALVHQLVELHGGRIEVTSEGAGRGSTFIISLPRAKTEHVTASSQPLMQVRALAGYRVLVVDDEHDWSEVVTRVLERHGADVVVTDNSGDAFTIVKSNDRPDVIVADIGLAGEDGYTLIRRVRADADRGERIPAIAITAYAGPDHRQQALSAGFDMYRSKPINPEEVATAVADLLKV